MTIKKSSGSGIPSGLNAGRPANPGFGQLYSNGETNRLELYTQSSGWQNIVQETPGVASIIGNYSEATNSGTISISGTNFVSGAIASAIGTNGVEVIASSTTYNSLVQLTAVFTGLSNANEPYNIKVTNPSNLFGLLPNALYVNASPVWQTASGSLGTFFEQVSITLSALSATDSDSTVTYALASGSTLPSGVTLNSSTGVISGTLPDISTQTTYSFTINATDGVNNIPRTFSILSNVNQPPTWSTATGTIATIYDGSRTNYSVSVIATDPESNTLTYSLVSGTLPASMTLNTSTGVISGTPSAVVTDTTYSFILGVSDGTNPLVTRSFNIIVKAPVVQVFTYTGADQVFTIPNPGIQKISCKIWGAGGGNGPVYLNGGGGGFTIGTLTVPSGTASYRVVVGESYGYTPKSSIGYGGAGYRTGSVGTGNGANGGGLSGIFTDNNLAVTFNSTGQARAIAIAGGGGGSGYDNQTYGGAGGGSSGGTGIGAGTHTPCTGGTQSVGGSGNYATGTQLAGASSPNNNNGGGGGGYWGGGTSNGGSSDPGGGGGSGYIGGNGTHIFTGTTTIGENGINGPKNPAGTSDSNWDSVSGKSNQHGRVVLIY